MTFRLTMYPGLDGDCLLLSWGEGGPLHHLLVDLGRHGTYAAVKRDLAAVGELELFVMSHIDADHIAGAVPLVRENAPPFRPKRVWYNARPQLVAAQDREPIHEPFSARQGEKLSRGIVNFGWPWNGEFSSEIVSTDSPEALRPIPLAGDLSIRLLSPPDAKLKQLLPEWDNELAKVGIRTFDPDAEGAEPLAPQFERLGALNVENLAGQTYQADETRPNGTSIAFIAEFAGKRILLAADAHSDVLEQALGRLAEAEGGRYRLDLLKVSHHGSKANTSPGFVRLIDCTRFAVSTNGSRHKHPDRETIARLLFADQTRTKTFFFNYRQPGTEVWESPSLKARWRYDCVFPSGNGGSENGALVIDI